MPKFSLAGFVLLTLSFNVAAQPSKVIPYIAQDDHSTTWIHVVNACDRKVSYEIEFRGSDGAPMELSISHNEGLWEYIYQSEMGARANHFWEIPETAQGVFRVGYAVVEDDGGGCVSFDVAYGEEMDPGDLRVALGFVNETSSAGVVQPFINGTGCDTGVSVVGSGEQVSIEATDWQGNSLGRSDLGRVHYVVFLVNEEFPSARGKNGLVTITGGSVAALGFLICDERLVMSRRAYPIPGAGSGNTTDQPGPSSSEYEVVEFATKHLDSHPSSSGGNWHEYSYRLVLKNPSEAEHSYEASMIFRDSDGFVVDRSFMSFVYHNSRDYPVKPGETRTFEGTEDLIEFIPDHNTVKVDVEVSVVE